MELKTAVRALKRLNDGRSTKPPLSFCCCCFPSLLWLSQQQQQKRNTWNPEAIELRYLAAIKTTAHHSIPLMRWRRVLLLFFIDTTIYFIVVGEIKIKKRDRLLSLSPRLLLSPPPSPVDIFFFFCYFLFFRKSRFFFIFLGRFAHFILTLRSALMYLVTLLFIVFDFFFLWNSREGFYLFKRKKENLTLKVGRIEFTHASSAFTNDHPPTHSYNRLSYVGILSSLYYTIPATHKKNRNLR